MLQVKRTRFSRKTIIVISAIVVIVLIGIIIPVTISQNNSAKSEQSNTASGDSPSYATILPVGKSISDLGGWRHVTTPENESIYIYSDKIGNVPINVSEQPLPASFKNNLDGQVAEVAKKFNATTALDTGNTKFYLGTSSKGPQSVIFAKNNVLILIKSQQKIADKDWSNYIELLK